MGFLRRRCADDAEELAQEVWVRVTSAKPPTEARAFRAYVFTVARRLLIDRHRRSRTMGRLVALDGGKAAETRGSTATDPHSRAVAVEVLEVVEQCLASMKPEVAQVFRWRATTDLSFKDIAARQNCSLNTALGRQHQAARRIARALEEKGISGRKP